jgi:hypothetical protein
MEYIIINKSRDKNVLSNNLHINYVKYAERYMKPILRKVPFQKTLLPPILEYEIY